MTLTEKILLGNTRNKTQYLTLFTILVPFSIAMVLCMSGLLWAYGKLRNGLSIS